MSSSIRNRSSRDVDSSSNPVVPGNDGSGGRGEGIDEEEERDENSRSGTFSSHSKGTGACLDILFLVFILSCIAYVVYSDYRIDIPSELAHAFPRETEALRNGFGKMMRDFGLRRGGA
jgi:hypothetical protein